MAARYEILASAIKTVGASGINVVASGSATIKDLQGNNLTVYQAETGATTVTNPITTDSAGRIEGWVDAPDFDITISGTGFTTYTLKVRQSPAGTYNVKSYGAVGDGTTDDTAAIQAADTAAATLKGTVVFPQGTFIAANVQPSTGVRWQGTGGAVLKLKNSSAANLLTIGTSVTDVVIDGLELDGNSANVSSSNVTLVVGGQRNRITNCYVHDSEVNGIQVSDGADHITIDNNRVTNSGTYGITCQGTSGSPVTNILITGNHVKTTTTGGALGIVGVGNHVVFSHNSTDASGGDGIAAYNHSNQNISAVGNTIKSPANNGIHLGGNNLLIEANVIKSCSQHGIDLINDDTSAGTDFVIVGNNIDGAGNNGIYVDGYSRGTISGNKINGSATHGIDVEAANVAAGTIAITGNVSRAATAGSGIRIAGGTSTAVSKVTITGNISELNGSRGITVAGTTSPTHVVIVGNVVTGNTGVGIHSANSADFLTIDRNDVYSNTGGNISLVSGSSNRIGVNPSDDSIDVASVAGGITLPLTNGPVYRITGTSAITGVTAANNKGRVVTLLFTSTASLADSGNLVLNGAFSGTANDTITLVSYDAVDWYEVCRSAN